MAFIAARVVAALLLFWALDRHPYAYFVLLRWVTCGVCAYGAWHTAELSRIGWAWVFGIIAVVFNPIAPLYLDRETWVAIDVVVGLVLMISIWALREPTQVARNLADSNFSDTNLLPFIRQLTEHLFTTRLGPIEKEAHQWEDGVKRFLVTEKSIRSIVGYVTEAEALLSHFDKKEWIDILANAFDSSNADYENSEKELEKSDPLYLLHKEMEQRFYLSLSGEFGYYVKELSGCLAMHQELTISDIQKVKICEHGCVVFVAHGETFGCGYQGFACGKCSEAQQTFEV